MTTEQLGEVENELLYRLTEISKSEQTLEPDKRLESIFESYKQIHQAYAELADNDDEALKRGLFIQWYSWTEPSFNSGISVLDPQSEQKIIKQIENKLSQERIDEELRWMLNYYASWEFVFERFKNFERISKLISNKTDLYFPSHIDRKEMVKRGQMGSYWNSLTRLGG